MKALDIVLDQVEKSTSRKQLARDVGKRIKSLLAHATPMEDGKIDFTADTLIETIKYIRNPVGKGKIVCSDYNILKSMLVWQCAFYRLNRNIEVDLKRTYSYFMLNHSHIYSEVMSLIGNLDPVQFNFSLSVSSTLSESMDGVKVYCDALPTAVKSVYKIINHSLAMECKGIMPFLIFHQEVHGREATWKDKVEIWFACHEAYRLHKVEGWEKVQVIEHLAESPLAYLYNFNLDSTEQANAIHKLDKFLKTAKCLVASAANGTFPC